MLNNLKEYTIECSFNLHKKTFGIKFKNRVSKAIKEIRKFSHKLTKVNTIRIDPLLNKILCKGGSKRVPNRIRIRLSKKKYLMMIKFLLLVSKYFYFYEYIYEYIT